MALRCDHLHLRVPGRTLYRDLTLSIRPGELWAVLGRNGSGKTTLMHALAGLPPGDGAITLDDRALSVRGERERAREVGILLQHEDGLFWGSTAEYVRLGRFPHASAWTGFECPDEAAAERALQSTGLAALAGRRYETLSGGERQRARIAQLLAQAPRYLLLDEPLQHLDLRHQRNTLKLFRDLAREDRAVAMVLHDVLWPGRYCTHALLLYDDGEARAGLATQMLTRENLERLYGCPLAEITHAEGSDFVPKV